MAATVLVDIAFRIVYYEVICLFYVLFYGQLISINLCGAVYAPPPPSHQV